MAKVFIINDMNHNFEKAEKYGTLQFVTTGKVPIFKTDAAKNMLLKGLQEFDIREDYLLISGPAILCMQAALIVAGPIPIKALVFDAKQQDYTVRHISI